MDITFSNKKFEDECHAQKLLERKYGVKRANLIRRRLNSLYEVVNLEELRNVAGRCHELRGNRKWHLSLDLDGPYRLIFEPAHEPIPCKDDGGLDWLQVTAVRVIGVEDPHG